MPILWYNKCKKKGSNVNDVEVPYQIKPRRAGDIASAYANTDKAAELLHWKAEKQVEDMCRDSWTFVRNR